jgi:hypothetical protein
VFATIAVGLNPLVLVHVVGGAHNDALVMLLVMGGVLGVLSAQPATAGGLAAGGGAVKASGALAAPFMLIGTRDRGRFLLGALATVAAVAAAALAAFGWKALQAFVLIGQNQERTTRWSVPQKLADGIGAITGGDSGSIVHFTRAALAVLLAAVLAYLLLRAWRERSDPGAWVLAAGWATLAVLVATAWLVPWYAIWVLPLAAISRSRALMAGTIMLCAYMLVIAVPL